MIVYRLTKAEFRNDLAGKGAEKYGGRWNNKGNALLYTCESRALCTTEIAVHAPLGIIPTNYFLATIEIPDEIEILQMDMGNLPTDWKSCPHSSSTQHIGDEFIKERKFLAMEVSSAVVQGEYNYVINPKHTDMHKIKLLKNEPFSFDKRLFK